MSISTHTTHDHSPAGQTPSPEIYVPDELAPWYSRALDSTRVRYSELADDVFLKMSVRRSAQEAVLRVRGLMRVPGSVQRPPALGVVGTAVLDGSDYEQWLTDYHADRALDREIGDDVRSEIEHLASAILDDPARLLAWHRHRVALSTADQLRNKDMRSEEAERARVLAYSCPVCGQCDDANGRVMSRPLSPEPGFMPPEHLRLKSCLSCHTVAIADRASTLGAEVVASGVTRLAKVRSALGAFA